MLELQQAARASEILIAIALIQQSIEHLSQPQDRRSIFAAQVLLCLSLIAGFQLAATLLILLTIRLFLLGQFQGPYNGGSDRMAGLVLLSLAIVELATPVAVKEIAMGYLALQLLLSYFQPGVVKALNPEWRSGEALAQLFRRSTYPTAENLRPWAQSQKSMWVLSWATISFELLFPLTILQPKLLQLGLALALVFHLANAMLFGLNRFFWVWPAAYPALIWFQSRIFA